MKNKEVFFYMKISGECPIKVFLDSLPPKVAQKVAWVLSLAEDLHRIPAQYFSKLTGTDDIWEFRIKLGSNIYRVLAFFDGFKIIATNGFIKKTQKTPLQEIALAENFKKDYEGRMKGRSIL